MGRGSTEWEALPRTAGQRVALDRRKGGQAKLAQRERLRPVTRHRPKAKAKAKEKAQANKKAQAKEPKQKATLQRADRRVAMVKKKKTAAPSAAEDPAIREHLRSRPAVPLAEPVTPRPQAAAQAARPQQSLAAPSQPQLAEPPAPHTPSDGNAPPSPQPWETHAKQAGSPPVPKWADFPASYVADLQRFSRNVLAQIPAQMRRAGSRRDSTEMNAFIQLSGYKQILRALSFAVVLRILGTDLIRRETELQKATLARAALEDALESLIRKGTPKAAELKHELAVTPAYLSRLAIELVTGCQGLGLT